MYLTWVHLDRSVWVFSALLQVTDDSSPHGGFDEVSKANPGLQCPDWLNSMTDMTVDDRRAERIAGAELYNNSISDSAAILALNTDNISRL
jgi:hypothetical protein